MLFLPLEFTDKGHSLAYVSCEAPGIIFGAQDTWNVYCLYRYVYVVKGRFLLIEDVKEV